MGIEHRADSVGGAEGRETMRSVAQSNRRYSRVKSRPVQGDCGTSIESRQHATGTRHAPFNREQNLAAVMAADSNLIRYQQGRYGT